TGGSILRGPACMHELIDGAIAGLGVQEAGHRPHQQKDREKMDAAAATFPCPTGALQRAKGPFGHPAYHSRWPDLDTMERTPIPKSRKPAPRPQRLKSRRRGGGRWVWENCNPGNVIFNIIVGGETDRRDVAAVPASPCLPPRARDGVQHPPAVY